MSLTAILIILLVVAVLGGGMTSATYGRGAWSPAGVIVIVLLILLIMGRL
jgi:hypothetical protein